MAITKVTSGLISADASSIDLNIDAGTLYLDVSENRVGIGTTSPKTTLNVAANNSGQGPILTLENTDTSLTTNDVVGQIDFYGNDGSTGGTGQKATIQAIAQNSSGTSVGLIFGTSPFPDTTATERMRIDSSGNVGIGTNNPSNKLHVYNTASADVALLESTQVFSTLAFKSSTNSSTVTVGIDGAGNASFENKLSSGNMTFVTNGSERARIDSSGRVGIGTSSPDYLLEVETASSSVAPKLGFRNTQAGAQIGMPANTNALALYTGDNERMRIDSSGNLLINTTSALDGNSKLQVLGSTGGGRAPVVFQNSVDAGPALSIWKTPTTTSSSARFIQFYANGDSTPMGGIVGNGASNVQFATLSDEREKENITPVDNVLNKLMNLNVVSFDWKKNDEHVKAGFIAQNVEEHFPEYVIENIANDGEESRKGTTGGMSAGYIAVLTKAIQEQQTIIDNLKTRIETLESA